VIKVRAVRVRAIRVRARAGANLRLEVKVPQLAELRARLGELLYLGVITREWMAHNYVVEKATRSLGLAAHYA
jgi:hypothetical protein